MGTRIKSNAVDRLPNNKHPNMKTSTLFVLAASCALLASGASAEGPEHHDDSHHDPCKCRDSCEYVNDYHICYVRDPHACHDAFPSRYYEDEKWIWCPWEEEKHDDWNWHDWKHHKKDKKHKHGDWDKWWDKKKDKKHKHGDSHKKKSYKNWFKKSGGKFGR